MDEAKLHQFVGQMLGDLGGAFSVALIRIGDQLGLYKTLHAHGPMTAAELAAKAGVNERYLREWAAQQAASKTTFSYGKFIRVKPCRHPPRPYVDPDQHKGRPGAHQTDAHREPYLCHTT